MRKSLGTLLATVVLTAAGFAAASIATGGSLASVGRMLTGGTGTTATTGTIQTATTETAANRRVTICHITGSKKHPAHTITVDQDAVPAHLRHGDHLGPCTGAEQPRHKGGDDSGKPDTSSTPDSPKPGNPPTTTDQGGGAPAQGGNPGRGNGNDPGQGKGSNPGHGDDPPGRGNGGGHGHGGHP